LACAFAFAFVGTPAVLNFQACFRIGELAYLS
jgi:hypothetical protein